jgi:hypothetical protein
VFRGLSKGSLAAIVLAVGSLQILFAISNGIAHDRETAAIILSCVAGLIFMAGALLAILRFIKD